MNPSLFFLEILTSALGLLVLLGDLFAPRVPKRLWGYAAAGGLGLILGISFFYSLHDPLWDWRMNSATEMFLPDGFALFFKRLFLAAGILVCLLAVEFSPAPGSPQGPGQNAGLDSGVGEFFALLLFALTGMLLAASANDFILLFVALELVTVTFYILTSYQRRQVQSLEAGVKYLILGALSSALLVYGIAFVFGTTGTTNFGRIGLHLLSGYQAGPLFWLGITLILAGLSFKIAAVPFQVWAPDVYQGAPTPVTAFLAVGSKATGFVLLLRMLLTALPTLRLHWMPLMAGVAGATILYGNFGALAQRNVKRLLGYSSIGHTGFLLMGVAAASPLGARAVLFYLGGYLFTTLGAFTIVVLVGCATGSNDVDGYRGLAKRSPLLAWAMTVALASLAGLPPLVGFFGKFLVFAAILEQRMYGLAVVGLIGVGASLYFYLGLIRVMFWEESAPAAPVPCSTSLRVALWFVLLATIFLGVYPTPLLQAAASAVHALGWN